MANAVFWRFSTIAQTLAGAIALLGAFTLFKLQSVSKTLEEDAHDLQGALQGTEDWNETWQQTRSWIADRKYDELINALSVDKQKPGVWSDHHDRRLDSIKRDLGAQKKIRGHLECAFFLTAPLIVVSVGLLFFAPWISTKEVAGVIFLVGILWLCGCLWSYYRLIKSALE